MRSNRKIYFFSDKAYNWEEFEKSDIYRGSASDFLDAVATWDWGYQLDVETDMSPNYYGKELILVQIGNLAKTKQYVFDVNGLSDAEMTALRKVLANRDARKLAHGAMMEYVMIKNFFGIDIARIRDTFLALKWAENGIPSAEGAMSLAGACSILLNVELDKYFQTKFHKGLLSAGHIIYAADDVVPLGDLYKKVAPVLKKKNLEKAFVLKCDVLRWYGDQMSDRSGMIFNADKWLKNLAVEETHKVERTEELHGQLLQPPFREVMESKGHYTPTDTYTFKWTSSVQKKHLFRLLIPGLESTAKKALKVHDDIPVIAAYLDRQFEEVEQYFIDNHKDVLLELGIFVPASTVSINLGSQTQMKEMFRVVYPDLNSIKTKELAKLSHPMASAYRKFVSHSKLASSYGASFLDEIDADGKCRVRKMDMLLVTGRISAGKLLTLPKHNRYRNCFEAPEGHKLVGADYDAMESAILAYLAQDEQLLKILEAGADLHSNACYLVFGEEWTEHEGVINWGEEFYGAPKTAKGKELRGKVKGVNFGIPYGISAIGLADQLNITVGEARKLIAKYFDAFKQLAAYLETAAAQAIHHLYSVSLPPFNYRRSYAQHVDDSAKGRFGKNFPNQSTSASITEYASVLCKKEIEARDWGHLVVAWVNIHDELQTIAADEIAEEWGQILQACMIKAAKIVITNGLLTASADINTVWTK